MGQIREVRIPDIGDPSGVAIVEVHVKAGDRVAAEDPLITLEGDKASMDVPAPFAGEVREVKIAVGDPVTENALIALIELIAAAPPPAPEPAPPPPSEAAAPEPEPAPAPAPSPPPPAAPETTPPPPPAEKIDEAAFAKAHASPAVRRFARELGVDLGRVRGSGRKGRILKDDVQAFVKSALAAPAAAAGPALAPMPEVNFAKYGPVETVPLGRIRKLSAASLHRSWLHVPHVTQFDEADVTDLEAFREEHKDEAAGRGLKLTFLSFLLKASAASLKEFPDLRSSLDPSGESLIVKDYFHVGVAVDTPNGLIVPVVRDVDRKGLYELAADLADLSGRAREGKLLPQDLQGACFSISSLGGIGGTAFTPIVNAPEVAILGVSRAAIKPVWQEGEFRPRLMLPLALSYDHRVIDGAVAARFIVHLSRLLADVRRLLL